MKTYILKRSVYNNIDFPIGTIVKVIQDDFYNFEVVDGDLIGEKGSVANGLDGFIVDDTVANREKLFRHITIESNLLEQLRQNQKQIDDMPNAVIIKESHND